METRSGLGIDETAPSPGEDVMLSGNGVVSTSATFAPGVEGLDGKNIIGIMQNVEREQLTALRILRAIWSRSYRAFHSKHWEGSKYTKPEYLARSRLFRPKTRSAVIKNQATAAAALFSTADTVSVKAELEDEPKKKASADAINAVLNYRLDRSSSRGGIPWFRVSMGASFNAQVTGICASKQDWEYRTIKRKKTVEVEQPLADPDGNPLTNADGSPLLDQSTGQPFVEMVEQETVETIIVADRPTCELYPPEHVWIDLRGAWENPAQDGAHLTLRKAWILGDLKAVMKEANPRSAVRWLEIDDKIMLDGTRDYDGQGLRNEREGNTGLPDRKTEHDAPADDFQTVWVHENFMRFNGEEYHWYSLGTRAFLSEIACTRDIYPQHFGQRPVTFGVAAIEPHVIYVQSPVEAVQGLQAEMNDIANLNLDGLRQAIEPIAKMKSGSLVDAKQLRMRASAGATMVVHDMDDLKFERIPEPSGQAYVAQAHLNADFDDAAGLFSGGSVQTNRSLNETVGGMRLLTGAANATTEFNLRIWVETWVEPTLRQIIQSIQYYETDEVVLAIAGQRAQLLERYGIDKITDDMLESEVSCTVNVGVGAVDPMQRMQKFLAAFDGLGKIIPFADRDVQVNVEEVAQELFGAAGYKEGMRFLTLGEKGKKQKSPEAQKAEIEAASQALALQMQERIGDKKNASAENTSLLHEFAAIVGEMLRQEGEQTRAVMTAQQRRQETSLNAVTKLAGGEQNARSKLESAAAKPQPKKAGGNGR